MEPFASELLADTVVLVCVPGQVAVACKLHENELAEKAKCDYTTISITN